MVINEKIFNGKPFAIIYLSKQEQDSQQTMDLIGKMKKRYKNNISIIYSGERDSFKNTIRNLILSNV